MRLGSLFASILAATTGCSERECDTSEVVGHSTVTIDVVPDGGSAADADAAAPRVDDCTVVCQQISPFEVNCAQYDVESCAVGDGGPQRLLVTCNIALRRECAPPGVACGRRTGGTTVGPCDGTIGGLFAFTGSVEAASVPAFARLRRELRLFGAPRSLLRASRRARRDEVLHARRMRGQARRFGRGLGAMSVAAPSSRSLVEFAIENEVEGCVRETYGALVATYQSLHATDAEVRALMRRIARDETRHAELAREISRFCDARLSVPERARVSAARRDAVIALRSTLERDDAPDLRAAGLPPRTRARSLLIALFG